MLSPDYRGRWMSPCTAWSYVTRHPQAQISHPICHSTQRQSAPCQQIPLKLSHGFNAYGTSRGTFKTGWILCSTCREISCFLVEGGSLSSFLVSGDIPDMSSTICSSSGWYLQCVVAEQKSLKGGSSSSSH